MKNYRQNLQYFAIFIRKYFLNFRRRAQPKQQLQNIDKFELNEDLDIEESFSNSRRRRSSPMASAKKHNFIKPYKDFEYEKYTSKGYVNEDGEDDVSIEEIDDERIDEFVADNDKNLLIFFCGCFSI